MTFCGYCGSKVQDNMNYCTECGKQIQTGKQISCFQIPSTEEHNMFEVNTDKTLGKLISSGRQLAGMTQEELAERVGVAKKDVSMWEHDARIPTKIHLNKLSEIIDIPFERLYGSLGLSSSIAESRFYVGDKVVILDPDQSNMIERHSETFEKQFFENVHFINMIIMIICLLAAFFVNTPVLKISYSVVLLMDGLLFFCIDKKFRLISAIIVLGAIILLCCSIAMGTTAGWGV